MRISRFFIVFTTVFFLELVLLGVAGKPVVPLVFLAALSALAALHVPWYGLVYLFVGVSLSAFAQAISPLFATIAFGVVTLLSILFRGMLENHWLIQSALAIVFGILFMGIACFACLTISNICVTILVVPIMIKFLQ